MQRYFVPVEQFYDNKVQIAGDDVHHLTKVMRAKPGDRVIVSNGADREALVEIVHMDQGTVTASIIERLPMTNEPAVRIWIAQSLPKGDKMETIIRKCTEIGASRFIPFVSERTIVQYDGKKEAKRLERWNKIAKEAAEQAHRNRIPRVEAPVSWKQLLQLASEADMALLCYEKEQDAMFRNALHQGLASRAVPPTVLLAIGPEGGFTEAEAAEAESAGCSTVSLGRRILRTETAAMVGLTCILYESGEMGVD